MTNSLLTSSFASSQKITSQRPLRKTIRTANFQGPLNSLSGAYRTLDARLCVRGSAHSAARRSYSPVGRPLTQADPQQLRRVLHTLPRASEPILGLG